MKGLIQGELEGVISLSGGESAQKAAPHDGSLPTHRAGLPVGEKGRGYSALLVLHVPSAFSRHQGEDFQSYSPGRKLQEMPIKTFKTPKAVNGS